MGCDFNFNPNLIASGSAFHWGDKIPSMNNIKYINPTSQRFTTVDGILLSRLPKQRVHLDKIPRLLARNNENQVEIY